MKIVNVDDFFHPDAGYQMNILGKYMVKAGHDVCLITAELDKIPSYLSGFFNCDNVKQKDDEYTNKYGMKIIRIPLKEFVSGRAIFQWEKLKEQIVKEKPDVIFAHQINTVTAVQIIFSKAFRAVPIVSDCHMVEIASVNKYKRIFEFLYKRLITPRILKRNIPVIRLQDEGYVEKCLGIPLVQCPFISFGSDVLLFKPDESIRKKFRTENFFNSEDFIVLYAGKLDEYKNGLLLANAIKDKFNSNKNVKFVIVGQCIGDYGKQVEAIFEQSENLITRYPTQKYEDLAQFYQACDMAIFPRQCSLSFYDVQACGLPVVFEDIEVNRKRIYKNNAKIFKPNDVEDFRNKILEIINAPDNEYRTMTEDSIEYVKTFYNYERIAYEYLGLIEDTARA